MDIGIVQFFNKMPQALPLYLAFEEKIRVKYPGIKIKVQNLKFRYQINMHLPLYGCPFAR